MMSATSVFERVLDKLKTGQPDSVIRHMVGASSIGRGEGVGPRIRKGRQPAAKKRANGFVALHVNPPNFARAIVEVEIDRERVIFRLSYELAGRARRHWHG